MFGLDVRNYVLAEGAARRGNRLPRAAGESPSQTAWLWHFGTWFSRHGGDGLMVGLDDLGGLLQP